MQAAVSLETLGESRNGLYCTLQMEHGSEISSLGRGASSSSRPASGALFHLSVAVK